MTATVRVKLPHYDNKQPYGAADTWQVQRNQRPNEMNERGRRAAASQRRDKTA